MSTGGTSIDRTDDIHPDNAEIAREAAMVVGLDVAGIDFITPDIAHSIRDIGGGIVEVNSGPGFRMHTHPRKGILGTLDAPSSTCSSAMRDQLGCQSSR
jgi:cyanophycin synthetase